MQSFTAEGANVRVRKSQWYFFSSSFQLLNIKRRHNKQSLICLVFCSKLNAAFYSIPCELPSSHCTIGSEGKIAVFQLSNQLAATVSNDSSIFFFFVTAISLVPTFLCHTTQINKDLFSYIKFILWTYYRHFSSVSYHLSIAAALFSCNTGWILRL